MTPNETIDYYNQNASAFTESSLHVDFTAIQQIFLKALPRSAHILDFGCGTGRDARCFLEQGYLVTAVDGSEALCKVASEYAGIPVRQMLFQEMEAVEGYDGIWACASILHLQKVELADVLRRMKRALRSQGVIYTSFKYGTYEGMRNGRYFIDFTEETFAEFMRKVFGLGTERTLEIEKIWITGDVREGRGDERWLNILLRKLDTP